VLELGERVAAGSGIEIFVLQRHCQTPMRESQIDNRMTQTKVHASAAVAFWRGEPPARI
jgi:hypothetical protein